MLGRYNFLLLDEPTNHLDAFSREELENTLLDYSGTMLIVSHDRYFINKLATRILELTPSGMVEYLGNYDDYIERKNNASAVVTEIKKEKTKKTNDYLLKKERRSQYLKTKTALSKVEAEIEELEIEIENINSRLSTVDYEELMKLTSTLDTKNEYMDILYSKWEELSQRLTELEE